MDIGPALAVRRRRTRRPGGADAAGSGALLVAIVIAAAALRLHGLPQCLPYSYFTDEMTFVNRAMAMGTGDLNPHWFNKAALLMYLLLAYGALFAVGWLAWQFASPDAFGAYFLAGTAPVRAD